MKRLQMTILFVAMAFTTAQIMAQEPKATLDFDNGKKAEEILKKYTTALQSADAEGIATLMSKDAMIYGLGGGLDSLNATQHKAYWENSLTTYSHSISQDLYLPIKVENNWNEGEWLLSWGINTITNKKTGNVTPVPYHIASLVADNKITAMHFYLDYASLLTKQGYQLTPPNE